MIKTFAYPLTIEACEEDGGYLATFPTLPGCQTWGETYETAIRNAEEALAVFIETLTANADPIPETAARDRVTEDHEPVVTTRERDHY